MSLGAGPNRPDFPRSGPLLAGSGGMVGTGHLGVAMALMRGVALGVPFARLVVCKIVSLVCFPARGHPLSGRAERRAQRRLRRRSRPRRSARVCAIWLACFMEGDVSRCGSGCQRLVAHCQQRTLCCALPNAGLPCRCRCRRSARLVASAGGRQGGDVRADSGTMCVD